MIANNPINGERVPLVSPAITRAPIMVIPDMAFDPDMSGVCSVVGTLEITSKPTKLARINMYKLNKRLDINTLQLFI